MTTVLFEHLLAAHAERVHRAALGLLGNEQEAREAAQEALLKAYRARQRYQSHRPFYPWLYRIVRNTCFDELSRRKHRATPGLDDQRVVGEQPTALDRLESIEAIASVRQGMERLSASQREILSMRHFQDLSYAEMGELLEIPVGTVMSRLYRARRALLRSMEEAG